MPDGLEENLVKASISIRVCFKNTLAFRFRWSPDAHFFSRSAVTSGARLESAEIAPLMNSSLRPCEFDNRCFIREIIFETFSRIGGIGVRIMAG